MFYKIKLESNVLNPIHFDNAQVERRAGKLVYKYRAKCRLALSSFEFPGTPKSSTKFYRLVCSITPNCEEMNPKRPQFDRLFYRHQRLKSLTW